MDTRLFIAVLFYLLYSAHGQGPFDNMLNTLRTNRINLQPLILGPPPPIGPAGDPGAGASLLEPEAAGPTEPTAGDPGPGEPPPPDNLASLDSIATQLQQLVSRLVMANSQLTMIVADLADVRTKLAEAESAAQAAVEPDPAPAPPDSPPASDPCSAPRAQDTSGLCAIATCSSRCNQGVCTAVYQYGASDLTALCTLPDAGSTPISPISFNPQPPPFLSSHPPILPSRRRMRLFFW